MMERTGSRIQRTTLGMLALLLALAGGHARAQDSPDDIIRTMKKAIVEKNDPMRNRMYFKLRALGKPAVKPLVALLSDPEAGVSEYAAFTLGWIAEPESIDDLLKFLETGNPNQQKAALQALGNMAWGTAENIRQQVHSKAVPKMIPYLESKELVVQREAAYAVGLAGDSRALPGLKKLAQHEDKIVRFLATEAVERINRVNQKSQ